jgi:hypothetical protein
MATEKNLTVWAATYDLLRSLGLTTVFGNPGSTEQPFLKNFPTDFEYILALQEASAVAMADGFAQATGRPVLVNLHTSAGTGNGMGNIMTAFQNKTPLIITAGQQTTEMIICDPLLTNRDETMLPRPYVKWSYEPKRAEDVPRAIMRAYALALQFERTVNRDNTVSFQNLSLQIERVRWRATLAGCQVVVHQHLDGTLSLTHGPHCLGRYTMQGMALATTEMPARRAVEKTRAGKVIKPTFPPRLEIPQTPRDSHFPTAPTAAG